MKILLVTISLILLCIRVNGKKKYRNKKQPPNIVLILADDLGWNEVSWHNSRIKTPHMEALSKEGVRLNRSYVTPKCSPSRAALLTGKYPFRIGLQRGAIERWQATGLNTSLQLLPEILQSGGYKTHLVGKWHLGYCHEDYLPNKRGFDTFFGQYTHVTDYYNRKFNWILPDSNVTVHDLHRNDRPSYEGDGEFSPDLYTRKAVDIIKNHNAKKPMFLYLAYQTPHMNLQPPPEKYDKLYRNSKGGTVKIYQDQLLDDYQAFDRASAISALDEGVHNVVQALKSSGLYENSVIVFSTDNGGAGLPSNFPLKGKKEQLYDGGVRGVGFVHSPLIEKPDRESNKLMFVTDWMTTFLSLAGMEDKIPAGLDSFNMWPSISQGRKSPRSEIVLNLDQDLFFNTWSAAIIVWPRKFIWGQSILLKQRHTEDYNRQELYNIKLDPSEENDLLNNSTRRKLVASFRERLINLFRTDMVAADYPLLRTDASNPNLFQRILSPGWCEKKV